MFNRIHRSKGELLKLMLVFMLLFAALAMFAVGCGEPEDIDLDDGMEDPGGVGNGGVDDPGGGF